MKAVSYLTPIALAVITSSASAVTFTLSDAEGDNTFLSSAGTPGAFTDSGIGGTRTFTYEVTGLDLAGDSSANDTALFTLNVVASSGHSVVRSGAGNAENSFGISSAATPADGGADTNEIDPGESITFSAGVVTITLGDATTDTAIATFEGFLGAETFFVNGDAGNTLTGATIGGNATLPGSGNGSVVSFDALSDPSISIGGAPAGNGFLVGNLGLQYNIEVIPEPSSVALVGLGGVLLARRRRA